MSASLQPQAAELGSLLGTRLKERRLELGKKLAEVAAAAGVSTGYLSAIEKGGSVPSLPVLARLSHALGVPLAEMLRTSASSRLARGRLSDGLGSKRLAADGSRLQIVKLGGRPNAAGPAPIALGATDVFIFLYRGRVEITVDGSAFELAPGDALHCDMPHALSWRVLGDERAVSLWAATNQGTRSA